MIRYLCNISGLSANKQHAHTFFPRYKCQILKKNLESFFYIVEVKITAKLRGNFKVITIEQNDHYVQLILSCSLHL